MNRIASLVGMALLLVATPALAASVETIQGRVSVNIGGQGFRPATAPLTAAAGDIVSAGPNRSAEIVYDDGCRVAVEANSMATVAVISPCSLAGNPAIVAGGAVAAAAAAAAVAVGVLALTGKSDDNKRPASP
jgi:hypothetical protein